MLLGDPVGVLSEQCPTDIGDLVAPAARALGRPGPCEIRQGPVAAVDPLLLTGRDEDLTLLGRDAKQISCCFHDLSGSMDLPVGEDAQRGSHVLVPRRHSAHHSSPRKARA